MGSNAALHGETIAADTAFHDAICDDLNTAEARAAIFDLVRAANTAADQGTLQADNATEVLALLARFDSIFDVLTDRDADISRAALAWAELEGVQEQAAEHLRHAYQLTDEEIDRQIAARNDARKRRDFKQADAIRDDLAGKGILLEDSRDGVHWKRK